MHPNPNPNPNPNPKPKPNPNPNPNPKPKPNPNPNPNPNPVPIPNPNQARLDLLLGKLVLFLVFNGASLAIILLFTFTPIYSAEGEARNRTAWGDACDANDELALAALGLS